MLIFDLQFLPIETKFVELIIFNYFAIMSPWATKNMHFMIILHIVVCGLQIKNQFILYFQYTISII